MCFVNFYSQCVHGSLEDPKVLTHHKLIHAASERVLSETKTVADENLKDKGIVIHYSNPFSVGMHITIGSYQLGFHQP